MSDTSVSAATVRYVEELEVALRHISRVVDPRLCKESGLVFEGKRQDFGWAGKIDDELDPVPWVAPEEWRTANDVKDNFDLYVNFEGSDCIDDALPQTWAGQFIGFAGSGMRMLIGTNALGRPKWKALLRDQTEVIDQLVTQGFRCDAREGELTLPVNFDKGRLAQAFEDERFEEALAPIADAMDRILKAKPVLDQLVAAIRAKV